MTQGKTLCQALKRKWMTHGQMLQMGISVCPWRRVAEQVPREVGYSLAKRVNRKGLTEWRLLKVAA